jgi:SAM-dependent methyltransferase
MSPEIHRAAAHGFAAAAEAYERGRPGFPTEAVEHLTGLLGLRPGRTVLDVGCGTGKLTRLLCPTGARIVGIDPVTAMLAVARDVAPDARYVLGTAERLPIRDGAADAAVVAQAFHWFDAHPALAALARVLPPGGALALVWNVRDETEPWVATLTDLIEPYRGDTPSHRSQRWLAAFEGAPSWAPPERTSFPYVHRTTPDAVVDRVLSISFIAALPEEGRRRVAAGVRDLLPPRDEVAFPYRTDVWRTARMP